MKCFTIILRQLFSQYHFHSTTNTCWGGNNTKKLYNTIRNVREKVRKLCGKRYLNLECACKFSFLYSRISIYVSSLKLKQQTEEFTFVASHKWIIINRFVFFFVSRTRKCLKSALVTSRFKIENKKFSVRKWTLPFWSFIDRESTAIVMDIKGELLKVHF